MKNIEAKLQLTPRLKSVADLIDKNSVIADVGTDHAYLPTYLILNGQINKAIASDIRSGPLERAAQTLEKYAVQDKIELKLCAGLDKIFSDDVDAVTICGMGGEMIIDILNNAQWTKCKKILVLQPQNAQDKLRKFLYDNGYTITQERVVRDAKHWYTIMKVFGEPDTSENLSNFEQYLGRKNLWEININRIEYLKYIKSQIENIIKGIKLSNSEKDVEKFRYYDSILSELNSTLNDMLKN